MPTVHLGGGQVSGPGAGGWASDVSITVEYEFVDVLEGVPLAVVERHISRSKTSLRATIKNATLALPPAGSTMSSGTVSFSGAGGGVAFEGFLESISHQASDGQILQTSVVWSS